MSHTLTIGLTDLSKELGESVTSTTTARIGHYNDAVVGFADERKWKFLVKADETLTTDTDEKEYDVSSITDKRTPGWVSKIYIGDATEQLGEAEYYYDEERDKLVFASNFDTSGETIHIYYYYIPARITETTSSDTFPLPDRYRKVVALLAASFVQRSRYLEAQANSLFNLYTREIEKLIDKQSETSNRQPKVFPTYTRRIGFKRSYPAQQR